jgi:hypothetical protein
VPPELEIPRIHPRGTVKSGVRANQNRTDPADLADRVRLREMRRAADLKQEWRRCR